MNHHLKRAYKIGSEQAVEEALDEAVKRLPPGPNIAGGKPQELSLPPAMGGQASQGANVPSQPAVTVSPFATGTPGMPAPTPPDVSNRQGMGAMVGFRGSF